MDVRRTVLAWRGSRAHMARLERGILGSGQGARAGSHPTTSSIDQAGDRPYHAAVSRVPSFIIHGRPDAVSQLRLVQAVAVLLLHTARSPSASRPSCPESRPSTADRLRGCSLDPAIGYLSPFHGPAWRHNDRPSASGRGGRLTLLSDVLTGTGRHHRRITHGVRAAPIHAPRRRILRRQRWNLSIMRPSTQPLFE